MLQKIVLYFTMIATYINLNFVWEFGGLLFMAKKKADTAKTVAKKQNVKEDAMNEAEETVKNVKDKKELVPEVFIQYEAIEAKTEDIIENIKKAYVADGHYVAGIKDLKVYIKPEDGCAYYVINGSYAGNVVL